MAELKADQLLLADVRNYLDITWTDESLDSKLTGLINRGKSYINGIAGSTQYYTDEGQARSLLFDYVRYFRSNAGEQFAKNYADELLALRLGEAVTLYETDDTDV